MSKALTARDVGYVIAYLRRLQASFVVGSFRYNHVRDLIAKLEATKRGKARKAESVPTATAEPEMHLPSA